MTTEELLALFNSLILKNRWWSRFANSQFMKMMSVFGAQIIYYARMYAETALPEGFISTANKRSSILAAAEDRGYVARLIVPSQGKVTISNLTDRDVQLPVYTTLWGDNQYPYVLMDVVNLAPKGQGVASKVSDITIQQMEKIQLSYTVNAGEEFYTVLIPKDVTQKAVSVTVYVTVNGKKEKWDENPQFRLANSASKNYVLFYKPTEQLGVRFGDGSIGMMIPDNCTVDIDVWTSEGDITLVSGQRLQPSGVYQSFAADVEIVTDTPITNGSAMESTEETRNRAMYSVAYDDQIVWRGDYKYFLKGKIAGLTWLNVWGEEEEEKANGTMVNNQLVPAFDFNNINTIFISAHKPGRTQKQIEDDIMAAINVIPNRLNKKFKYYPIAEKPFTIKLTGTAYTEVVLADAVSQIAKTLEERFGKDSNSHESTRIGDYEKVKVNDIWAAIQELKVLNEFEVEIPNMPTAKKLYDFIYLDAANSDFKITH